MSTLVPAGQPAQTPRAESAKVCHSPLVVCDLECATCLHYREQKPKSFLHRTMHKFTDDWIGVSDTISQLLELLTGNTTRFGDFDIFHWRFVDSGYWHHELCYIPTNMWIEVEWGRL